MKRAIAIIALTLPTAITAAPTYNEQSTNNHCEAEWGTDYKMQAYCRDKIRGGFDKYRNIFSHFANEEFPLIPPALQHCEEKWGIQWDMVEYCANKQVEATVEYLGMWREIPKEIADKIGKSCYTKWYPQVDMVAYCSRGQVAAWKQLNQ